jgi:hypothetical protein
VYDVLNPTSGVPVTVYCWISNGAAWVKIANGDSAGRMSKSTAAIGTVSNSWASSDSTGYGDSTRTKLSDADINGMMAVMSDFVHFLWVSSAPSYSLVIRAGAGDATFDSSLGYGMGIYGGVPNPNTEYLLRSRSTLGAPPTSGYANHGSTADFINYGQGQSVNRWFVGHCGSTCGCYSSNSGENCFNGGLSYNNHAPLPGIAGYIYHGAHTG